MYPVSAEYGAEMRKTVREAQVQAIVFLGVFDKTASNDASLDVPSATSFSQPQNLILSPNITVSYATFEGSGFRLDGKQFLLPESLNAVKTQGFVGDQISNSEGEFSDAQMVIVNFGSYHDMVGISMSFDEQFPLPFEIKVTGYNDDDVVGSELVTDITTGKVSVFSAFESINKITIEFVRVAANGRARLNSIDFGIGYTYRDKQIISISEKHQGSPVSLTLPSSSFEFSLHNDGNTFGASGDSAITRFLTEGQKASVDYMVSWDGGNQEIPGGVWTLKSWTADKLSATFQLENVLAELNNTEFFKGIYDGQPHSLYELAETVLRDAGVTAYYLDTFLQSVYTTAPIPIMTHAEALQIIANAGLSKLFVDREGKICIEATVASKPTVKAHGEEAFYSKAESVLRNDNIQYMTFENRFARLDGTQYLLPEEGGETLLAGWVAKDIASDSLYPENAYIELEYEAPTNVYSITIDWGGIPPESVAINSKEDGEWQDEITIFPTKQVETYAVSLRHCTNIYIRPKAATLSGIRPRISHIEASKLSDFNLDKKQVYEGSKEVIEVKLKGVLSQWVNRTASSETTEITHQKVKTNSGAIAFNHEIATDLKVAVLVDGSEVTDVTIDEKHYAYVSYVTLTSDTTKEVDIIITGKLVNEADVPISSAANENGENMEIHNPLFDSQDIAQTAIDWVKDYYNQRIVYDYNVRGFPELEYGDTIYLDGEVAATITNLELTYNGALNSSMRLRR